MVILHSCNGLYLGNPCARFAHGGRAPKEIRSRKLNHTTRPDLPGLRCSVLVQEIIHVPAKVSAVIPLEVVVDEGKSIHTRVK